MLSKVFGVRAGHVSSHISKKSRSLLNYNKPKQKDPKEAVTRQTSNAAASAENVKVSNLTFLGFEINNGVGTSPSYNVNTYIKKMANSDSFI